MGGVPFRTMVGYLYHYVIRLIRGLALQYPLCHVAKSPSEEEGLPAWTL
jgi:hypothetical protein